MPQSAEVRLLLCACAVGSTSHADRQQTDIIHTLMKEVLCLYESDAAPFKCVSGRRLSDDPVARMPPLTHPERYAPTVRSANLTTLPLGLPAIEAWMQPEH